MIIRYNCGGDSETRIDDAGPDGPNEGNQGPENPYGFDEPEDDEPEG